MIVIKDYFSITIDKNGYIFYACVTVTNEM